MFRTFARVFLPNPFDWMLKRTAKRGGRRVLIGWNRGLGDIPLGLFAMIGRVRKWIPEAEVTFLTRENLRDGFSLLENVKIIVAPHWKRGDAVSIKHTLLNLGIDPKQFDLIVENASPTDWVRWQRGKVVPKLKWDPSYDPLHEKFGLQEKLFTIGVQTAAETNYGTWRNWPLERWNELFDKLEGKAQVLLFGFGNEPKFSQKCIVDLRGKTTLFELLSIIKNRCDALLLPDSGILSMAYYLNASFPLHVVSLWADPNHGILKQGVASPNPELIHSPLIGEKRDLSTVTVDRVLNRLLPYQKVGSIILAGGQGTRLGYVGPKGLFPVAGKTLFQWLLEKVPDKDLPIAIMTSPLNHEETVAYFKKNHFFGCNLHFFQQETRPFLDEEKKPMDLTGPNGNGSVFRSFVKAGLADIFAKSGVDLVTIAYVENPLSDPFDLSLIERARETKADAVIKCIDKKEADPMMGSLVQKGDRIEIVEYTELRPNQKTEFAYSGQLAFTLSFFQRMAEVELPVHWVKKKVSIGPNAIWVWKGEHFIFDVLSYATRVSSVCAPRDRCYAPMKTLQNLAAVEKILRDCKEIR